MPEAKDIQGTVFKNGSATLLARVTTVAGAALVQADIASAEYSVYLLDDDDPDSLTIVEGHEAVALTVASIIYDTLQTGGEWTVDATGYNFAHTLDVAEHAAFTVAGAHYLIVFTLTPVSGQPILMRFRLRVK